MMANGWTDSPTNQGLGTFTSVAGSGQSKLADIPVLIGFAICIGACWYWTKRPVWDIFGR